MLQPDLGAAVQANTLQLFETLFAGDGLTVEAILCPNYTDSQLLEIKKNQALGKPMPRGSETVHEHQDIMVAEKFNLKIHRNDFARLKKNVWLNDEVINFFMMMLQERNFYKQTTGRKSLYLNTFYMKTMFNFKDQVFDYAPVKRWCKKLDAFQQDMIFFPVHHNGDHWLLCVVYCQQKMIVCYDSMPSPGKVAYCSAILEWLHQEKIHKNSPCHFDATEWNIVNGGAHVPKQVGIYDCGVFTCMAAEFISRNFPLTWYSQENVEMFRQRMAHSILRKTMLPEPPDTSDRGFSDLYLSSSVSVVQSIDGVDGEVEMVTEPQVAVTVDLIQKEGEEKKEVAVAQPEVEAAPEIEKTADQLEVAVTVDLIQKEGEEKKEVAPEAEQTADQLEAAAPEAENTPAQPEAVTIIEQVVAIVVEVVPVVEQVVVAAGVVVETAAPVIESVAAEQAAVQETPPIKAAAKRKRTRYN
jgi:sentrin-specific protease 1